MPRGNNMPQEDQLVKLLLVGPSKAGKTHYCMQAARDGFNVLYMDGDVSRPTIMAFSDETLERLWYMNLCDTQTMARQWQLTEKMFKTPNYLWDDTNQGSLKGSDASESAVWRINLASMTYRDVIVIDSWTSFINSVKKQIAKVNGLDLAQLGDNDTRSLYGAGNHMVDFILGCLQAAPCHVIVTAHPGEYEHKVKPRGLISGIKEKDMILKSVRSIPLSLSNPHGNKMGKYFTDVAWISPSVVGNKRMLDGRPDPERESGGRFNKQKPTDEFSFKELVKLAHGLTPDSDNWTDFTISGVEEFSKGEWKTPEATKAQGNVLRSAGGKIPLTKTN